MKRKTATIILYYKQVRMGFCCACKHHWILRVPAESVSLACPNCFASLIPRKTSERIKRLFGIKNAVV